MNPLEILDVLEARGAVLHGHFRLSSGRHSDLFVQKFRIFEDPRLTQRFGESIARLYEGRFDVVASPAVGAITLGFATALAADVRMIFAERTGEILEFRRGFELAPRDRTLVVEDVLTTGASAREVVELVKSAGAEVVGVGALIDRGDPTLRQGFGCPVETLVRIEAPSWAPEECLLCREGVDIDDPGSRRLRR